MLDNTFIQVPTTPHKLNFYLAQNKINLKRSLNKGMGYQAGYPAPASKPIMKPAQGARTKPELLINNLYGNASEATKQGQNGIGWAGIGSGSLPGNDSFVSCNVSPRANKNEISNRNAPGDSLDMYLEHEYRRWPHADSSDQNGGLVPSRSCRKIEPVLSSNNFSALISHSYSQPAPQAQSPQKRKNVQFALPDNRHSNSQNPGQLQEIQEYSIANLSPRHDLMQERIPITKQYVKKTNRVNYTEMGQEPLLYPSGMDAGFREITNQLSRITYDLNRNTEKLYEMNRAYNKVERSNPQESLKRANLKYSPVEMGKQNSYGTRPYVQYNQSLHQGPKYLQWPPNARLPTSYQYNS